MRETFKTKRRGDSLSADHVDSLSKVLRGTLASSSYQSSTDTGSFKSIVQPPDFVQDLFEIISQDNEAISLFMARPRWYDRDTSAWRTDDDTGPYLLDATMFDESTYEIGDIVVAYWDEQRIAFIPASQPPDEVCRMLVDVRAIEQPVIRLPAGPPNIHFCLEQFDDQEGGWKSVNDRIYTVNANLKTDDDNNPLGEISSAGHYTMFADGDETEQIRLRVTTGSELVRDVELEFCALRIEAKCRGGIQHTLGSRLFDGDSVHHNNFEAELFNDVADPLDRPYLELNDGKDEVLITIPQGQQWTFENNLNCKFSMTSEVETITDTVENDAVRSWRHVDDAPRFDPEGDECKDLQTLEAVTDNIFWFGHSRDAGIVSDVPQWYSFEARFTLNIPQGAVISSAVLRLTFNKTATNEPFTQNELDIFAYAYDDADNIPGIPPNQPAGSSCPEDGWLKTDASIHWSPGPITATDPDEYDTPEIRDVVQEIVSRPGWRLGNRIVFLVYGSWRGEVPDEIYENKDIKLVITWIR